ncbi:WD40 repeat-like protein [Tothia fuscella]|uniref:WD40 repeat-like protein n=1 Tax=Tothia fuscella TaxID=1048955 RepID=A0A9P4TX77_9PEZI|nr:WD40 repeat-like protein [Tothia fuscella]
MKLSTHSDVPVYTIAGSSTARPLPDWLIRKRKRSLKQDPEFANRVELLQDFEFEEASSCVRVSEDGNWVMSTGTYKPQIHAHHLPHLSLSFSRHTDTLNTTFLLLSSDYSKSLHLQTDRHLEFHTPAGCHYKTRIPRYGRDLIYDRRSAEALVPSVGVNAEGNGEVFRLNLEVGRFMKGYEIDVGGDESIALGGTALQGSVDTGSVNTASIAEQSHNLLAFGTSIGTIEFWDPRSKSRAGILSLPSTSNTFADSTKNEVTSLQFHPSGLTLASGTSNGLIHLYDLRSPLPLLQKDQGYSYPIQTLTFLNSPTLPTPKILSADKRIIKIWDPSDGTPWTSVEPAVDLNHVEWCRDSGMLLTANEGKQQHAFFIPQLGPAPKWCAFLDNLVEEMAEDPNDPASFGKSRKAGEVYDNYKFLTTPQLRQLNIDHLIGKTGLLRPYMHGFFVSQKLYEEAVLINNPDIWQETRAKSIKEKIDKERESRIRGKKKVAVKVNRKLAEKILEREEKNERRKAKRVLAKGGDEEMVDVQEDGEAASEGEEVPVGKTKRETVLSDPRFAKIFEDDAFAVDETSYEFRSLNPSTIVDASTKPTARFPKDLTAVEAEELEERKRNASSSEDDDSDDDDSNNDDEETGYDKRQFKDPTISRKSTKSSITETKTNKPPPPNLFVSSSSRKASTAFKNSKHTKEKSFGSRAAGLKDTKRSSSLAVRNGTGVGEKEVSFMPAKKEKKDRRGDGSGGFVDDGRGESRSGERNGEGGKRGNWKDRRSASGNVFRGL